MRTMKHKKTLKRRTKKNQTLWKQKGCAHSRRRKSCKVCLKKGGLRGGGCGCNSFLKGGSGLKGSGLTGAPYLAKGGQPPALVGSPWTPSVSGWPGVEGQANHFSMNEYKVDPQTQVLQERADFVQDLKLQGPSNATASHVGGDARRRVKRGGGLFPQDLVNLGRNISFGLGSVYNGVRGYPQPVSELPYKDQLVKPMNL